MNPYLLEAPAVISFSGGRTSGYMLYHILQAHGGKLPDGIKVVFCNTGKERPETLDFVERCSQEWGVEIVWLEYEYVGQPMPKLGEVQPKRMPGKNTFKIVNYATASRNGEPLEAAIKARNMLPNVMMRFCTIETKIRTSQRYLRSIGWDSWTNAIGFRHDEPHRVAKLNGSNKFKGEETTAPLFKAKADKQMVMDFWRLNNFDLQLEQHEGNCDLCFLKGAGKIRAILKQKPELASWWIRMEAEAEAEAEAAEAEAVRKGQMQIPSTAFFRKDRPRYRVQLEMAQRPDLLDLMDEPDELSIACHCTD